MARLALTATGSIGSAASISTVASATHLWGKIKFKVDAIRALTSAQSWEVLYVGDGTTTNIVMSLVINWLSSTTYTITQKVSGAINATSTSSLFSALPANGNDVELYFYYDNNAAGHGFALTDATGVVYNSHSDTGNDGNLPGTAGFGFVFVNGGIFSSQRACDIDGVALYSGAAPCVAPAVAATLTSALAYDVPAPGDTNILTLVQLDDTPSSNTVLDAVSGTNRYNLTASQYTAEPGGTWANAPVATPTGVFGTGAVGSVTLSITGGVVTVSPTGVSGSGALGNISVTGASGGAQTSGGRVVFTAGGVGVAASSDPNVQPLTGLIVKMKFKVDALLALTLSNSAGLFQIDDGTDANAKCYGYMSNAGAGEYTFSFKVPGQGGLVTGNIATASLPTAGNDIIVYMGYVPDTVVLNVYDSLGNSISANSSSVNLGNLPVITGNGILHVNYAQGQSSTASDWDGFAIHSALIATTALQWSRPTVNDAGIVSLYRFDEQAGTVTQDDLGGPSLALTSFTWEAGGTWDPNNNLFVPIVGVSGAGAVGTVTKVSSNVVVPITGVFGVGAADIIGGVDHTVYLAGVSGAGAVTAPTVNSTFGPTLLTGTFGTGAVGQVIVFVLNPGVSISPATCDYIIAMAIGFSTGNQGLAVAADIPTMMARIRSDQRAIFAKVADDNRTFYLRVAPVTSSNASAQRTIDTTALPAPLERSLQLQLSDGTVANQIDLLDTSGELAPRYYTFGTTLVEFGSDFSPTPGPVSGTFFYTQAPTDFDPTTAVPANTTVSLPGDWSDLLIVPLATYLAMSDLGRPPDEIQRLQALFDARMKAFMTYLNHYSGVPSYRFAIPRPLPTER